MRIGILTFHFVYNYGAMLQVYALMKTVEKMGHSAVIIDYRPELIDRQYRISTRSFMKKPFSTTGREIKRLIKGVNFTEFENFIKEKMKLSNLYRTLEHLPGDSCDLLICGSDQIWNTAITGYDAAYFLEFAGKHTYRLAYAASLGRSVIDVKQKEMLRNCLRKFMAVSVREEDSAALLREENIRNDCICTLDPVFLLENEWEKIECKEIEQKEPFLLFYTLGQSDYLENAAKILSHKLSCSIVAIHPFGKFCGVGKRHYSNIGPKQFLWLIHHAEYVCTDSFHALAFSSVFEKKVIVDDKKAGGNRLKNLIHLAGWRAEKWGQETEIEFYQACINDSLRREAEKSQLFLRENIEKAEMGLKNTCFYAEEGTGL